ncbi:MAG TPA: sigma-E processing peptidase SpoIIGA [Halanaerobiales bacterium]|nr:sigma-E processing peptidase SpoIIGA [Halanaerobiales bacterium]
MIIYADITFIINLLMTLAIIRVVAYLLEINIKWKRLLLASFLGTIYTFIVIFIQSLNFDFILKCSMHIFLNILTAILIIWVSFHNTGRKKLIKAIAYLYLVSFITIGTTISIFYIYGGAPYSTSKAFLNLAGLIILIILAKTGWRFLKSYLFPEQFCLPVKIYYQNYSIKLEGLIDTGNNLNDPLTGVPVMIIYLKSLLPVFPEKCQKDLKKYLNTGVSENNLELINLFNQLGLGNRVRLLPFSDLGQEHGIMVGFRPDMVEIYYQENNIKTKKIILGLSRYQLNDEDKYQILVHPGIIKLQT